MIKFSNIPISRRIFLSFFVIIFIYVAVASVSYYQINKARVLTEDTVRYNKLAFDLQDAGIALESLEGYIDRFFVVEYQEYQEKASETIDIIISVLESSKKEAPSHIADNIDEIESICSSLNNDFIFLAESKKDQANVREINEKVILIYEQITTAKKSYRDLMLEISSHISANVIIKQKLLAGVSVMFIALGISILAVGMLMSLFISGSISKPIIELKNVASEIGSGRLDAKIKISSKDEIGELASAFRKMAVDLKLSHIKLRKYASGLEQEVKKRTKQLDDRLRESEKSKTATMNIMEDLNETLEKLKELDTMKLQFLSSISHELRTPLTPIRSQLQRLVTKKINPKERKEVLNMILRNAVRLDKLISDLLEVNRIQSKRLSIAKRQNMLNEIVSDAVENQSILAREKGISIISRVPKLKVVLDRDRILEVFINLINNAIKYSNKGKIIIEARRQKGKILVSVKDNGIGIQKEEISQLFEIFHQVRSTSGKGTGIGLFICKGIIEAHRGKMWVKSPGKAKGTIFYFTLPLR